MSSVARSALEDERTRLERSAHLLALLDVWLDEILNEVVAEEASSAARQVVEVARAERDRKVG